MNYFIFNFHEHEYLIESFLQSAALAHKEKIKTEDWFLWKFRDNPFGESILACVEDNGKIVGCVGYGLQPFIYKEQKIKGCMAFENFVHPDYQGKGLFSKLITLIEDEITKQNFDFMLVFPNSNSLKAYQKKGWIKLDIIEYWIKGSNILKVPFNLKEIRKGFKPLEAPQKLKKTSEDFKQQAQEQLYSVIDSAYLKWRFSTYPVTEYKIIESDEYYSVLRIGERGRIIEAQVLFMNINDIKKFKFNKFIKNCKEVSDFDIISFPISKNNFIQKHLKKLWFIKVPSQTNICYKILNENNVTNKAIQNLSISAINYHTY